jgi:23S rRNA (pseudouridine1915-N3)-methyltransferase
MDTILLAIGKLRPAYREACDEYLQRLRRYAPFTEREVREAGRFDDPSAEETRRIAAALPEGATVVALDREGEAWASPEVARRLDRWRLASRPLALVIGGAFGLAPDLLRTATYRWSLGPLTLPHQLARVIVLEQWYRAWTILKGEPYHK